MARPRYRPKLPESLQAADHDSHVFRIAKDAAYDGLMQASGVDIDGELHTASSTPTSRILIVVGGVAIAVIVLVGGILIDGWT